MTPAQTQKYFREWGEVRKACLANGWTLPDRHELHRRALGRDQSSKSFTNAEFDKVLQVFWSYTKPTSVNAGVRQERMPRTRLEHKIKIEQMRMLAVLLGSGEHGAASVQPDMESAWEYAAQLMRSRFQTDDISLISDHPVPTRHDQKSDLECLRDTLSARINTLRASRGGAARGWSIHELKVAAGVECVCAAHCRPSPKAVVAHPTPPS